MANLALVFDVLAKDGASGTFRNIGDAAEQAGKKTSMMGDLTSRAMKTAGAAVAAVGIVGVFKDAVGAASDLNETVNKTNVIFGKNAGEVQKWASGSARSFGLSRQAALEAASGLGNMLTQLGYTGDAALDASTGTVKLAADLGSFNNLDTGDVLDRIGAAMRGEYDSLQLLIPNINAARVEQEAMAATGKTNAKELTAQEKAAATLAIVQRDGASAANDFAETSDGLANSTKILNAQWEDAKAKLGALLIGPVSGAVSVLNNSLIPAFEATVGIVGGAIEAFGDLPGPVQTGIVALGGVAMLKGPVSSALETIALKSLYMKDSIVNAGTGIGGFKAAGSGLLSFLGGPWGIAIAGATVGLSLLVSWLGKSDDHTKEVTQATQDYAGALRQANGVINESVRAAAAKAAQDAGLLDIAERVGIALPDVTSAITHQGGALTKTRGQLEDFIASHTRLVTVQMGKGGAPVATEQLDSEGKAALAALDALNKLSGQTTTTQADQDQLAAATTGVGGAMAGTVGQTEEAIAALEAWLGQLQQIGASFVEPISVYKDLLSQKQEAEQASAQATADATSSSKDSWRDYVGDVTVSLDEYAAKLQEQLTAQDNWRANIVTITQRGGLEVGQAIAAMGTEGVTLAAQLANGTDAEFQRMAALILEDVKRGGADWTTAMDNEMKVLAAISGAGGKASAQAIADQLGIGVDEVARIARQYGAALAGGVSPVLIALGKRAIMPDLNGAVSGNGRPGFVDGGYTGPGGKYTPAGIVHAGEFVLTKEQTDRLGIARIEEFANRGYANGGFVTAADVPRPPSTAPYGAPISTAGDATMQKGFDEVRAWLTANVGVAGSGAVTGQWMSLWNLVKGQVPQARINSTFRAGDPGYHGRNKAIDFGFGAGPGGAGSAGLASINRLLHDQVGRNLAELIYDGIGDDRPDLKNGAPHTYNPATRAQHHNHVHAAVYDGGGILPPGLTFAYNGTGQNETIRTAGQEAALGGPMHLTGTLEIGGDGLARIVDGRIVSALTGVSDRGAYNP